MTADVTEALLPCPFCGGAAELTKGMGEAWVTCACIVMASDEAAAIAAWNRRAPDKDAEDWAERAALAAARERAAIVAWLRNSQWQGYRAAERIERGEHLPATSAVKEPAHAGQCICPFPRLACPDCGHHACPACGPLESAP